MLQCFVVGVQGLVTLGILGFGVVLGGVGFAVSDLEFRLQGLDSGSLGV